jgi:GNAT superfamily N-acetyltransferase
MATTAPASTLHLTDQATDELRAAILAPLVAYNESRAGPSGHRPLVIAVHDARGGVAGGLWGWTSHGWLFTQLLVVPEGQRRGGLGRRIMATAEDEARARGCHSAWLDTFEFQARGFYEGIGYRVFGELPDYPVGHARFFLQKRLVDRAGAANMPGAPAG